MAGAARTLDFLDLHTNAYRRIRNLETGVHPVAYEGGYADTYGPALLVPKAGQPFQNPATSQGIGWQRRAGYVQLFGSLRAPGTPGWGSSAEYNIADLPSAGWPGRELVAMVALNNSLPQYANVRVQTDGKIYLLTPPGVTWLTSNSITAYFYGPSWPVDW